MKCQSVRQDQVEGLKIKMLTRSSRAVWSLQAPGTSSLQTKKRDNQLIYSILNWFFLAFILLNKNMQHSSFDFSEPRLSAGWGGVEDRWSTDDHVSSSFHAATTLQPPQRAQGEQTATVPLCRRLTRSENVTRHVRTGWRLPVLGLWTEQINSFLIYSWGGGEETPSSRSRWRLAETRLTTKWHYDIYFFLKYCDMN